MADQVSVVSKTTAGVGDVSFIDTANITASFSAAVLILSRTTAEGANITNGAVCVGLISAEGDEGGSIEGTCQASSMRNAVSTANQGISATSVNNCAIAFTSGLQEFTAVYKQAETGGFTITVVSATINVNITAIIFAGLARSRLGSAGATTIGAHEDVGGAGTLFQPDLLIGCAADGSISETADDATPNLGFAIRSGSQVSGYINFDRTADPGDADGYLSTSTYLTAFQGATRSLRTTTVTSFDSTGYNGTSSQGTQNSIYLAIKWTDATRVRVGAANLAVAGSTGLQAFNAFGFTPDVVLGFSSLLTSTDSLTDGATAATGGYFITGKYGSYAVTGAHQEGDARPSDAYSRQGAFASLVLDHTGTIVQQATWGGASGSGGFLLNFSTASQAGHMTALGIQMNYEAPRTQYKPRRARLRRKVRKVKRPTILGRRAGQAFPELWRAIKRFRDRMRERLFRRPSLPLLEPTDTTPSATGQVSEGDIVAAGAVRADVVTGGADAAGVF